MPRIFANNVDEEANFSDDGTTSRDNSESKGTLKKGPWTADEDAILTEYVKKHGEGNWNSVQKNCGLARCGKSCRLRWTNHLRPNLKKGAISEEEEKIIIELHAKLGNKWARMAAQLPGRTDNEIKNFWNTRMKRRQRAGLPLYPPGVQDEFAVNDNLQIQHDQSNSNPSPSAFSLSSLISSAYHQNLTNPLHNMNRSDSASAYYTKTVHQFNENSAKGNMVLPLFPVSPYGPSYLMPFAHSFSATDSHGFHSEAFPMVHGGKTEVSWSKTTGSETPASSNTSGFDGLMGASSVVNDCYVVAPPANCGLLDALVVEAQTLSHSEKSNSGNSVTEEDLFVKEQGLAADDLGEEEDNKPVDSSVKDFGDTTTKIQNDDLNSSRSLTGKKRAAEYPMEEMNPMDDDLFCLLNNFPVEMPTPEWYRRGERQSLGLESPKYTLNTEHEELAWTLGTRWKNLPGIS